MAEPGTLARELASIPQLAEARLADSGDIEAVAKVIRAADPAFAVTIGRGSSDVVCEGLARALGTQLGLVAASLPPSLVTIDRARLRFDKALALVVSQSGRSPDLLAATRAARDGGALVIGIVNVPESPLDDLCHHVLRAGAHPEISIAATRSVILSWLTGAILIARVAGESWPERSGRLLAATLAQAVSYDAGGVFPAAFPRHVVLLGRGAGLPVVKEAALKFKELAGLSAEGLSAAEFRHGPRAALDADTALIRLYLPPEDTATMARDIEELGAATLTIACLPNPDVGEQPRPQGSRPGLCEARPLASAPRLDAGRLLAALPDELPALLNPIVATALCYPLAVALARQAGRNPDAPLGLQKVTLTL